MVSIIGQQVYLPISDGYCPTYLSMHDKVPQNLVASNIHSILLVDSVSEEFG